MAMQTVTCKACGREHKWREEMAGTEFLCHCGEWVYCPTPGDDEYVDQVADISKADALARNNEFEVDHGFDGDSNETSSGTGLLNADPAAIDDISADVGHIEFNDVTIPTSGKGKLPRSKAVSSRGMLGMNQFTEVCVWLVASMLGFTFTVLAAMNPSHIEYIVFAVLLGPGSWYMLRKSYLVWKRGRKFVIAVDQQLSDNTNS